MQCLSTINRGQHSRQQSHIGHRTNLYRSRSEAVLVSPATYIGCLSLLYGWVFSLRTRTWGNLARRRVVITVVRGHSSPINSHSYPEQSTLPNSMEQKTITLNNGVEMPLLGYGVYQVSPDEAERCVADALSVGYRMIDTAQIYQNEAGVGSAVKKSGLSRDEVFIVDKIWISNFEGDAPKRSLDESLRLLGTDYIDLMLIHQPFGDRYNAYRALEDALKEGKVRAIGVSNFYPDHLIDLCHFTDIVPAVNQVETHVLTQRIEERRYMDELGVKLMSWGPLAEASGELLNNEILLTIGAAHGKTVAQVAMRYLLQRGIIIIPKSTRKERMEQNFQLFDFTLTESEMQEILKLDTGHSFVMPSHHDPEVTKMFMGFAPRKGK